MLGLLLIVFLIAAVAVAAVAWTGGRRLPGRGGRPGRRVPATADRPRRTRRRHPHRSTPERVLLAEGEDIQDAVEARLTARGVAPHRLSGPNPPIPAERLASPPIPAERLAQDGLYRDPYDPGLYRDPYDRALYRDPYDQGLPATYQEPGIVLSPEVLADQAALDEQELRRRARARRLLARGR